MIRTSLLAATLAAAAAVAVGCDRDDPATTTVTRPDGSQTPPPANAQAPRDPAAPAAPVLRGPRDVTGDMAQDTRDAAADVKINRDLPVIPRTAGGATTTPATMPATDGR